MDEKKILRSDLGLYPKALILLLIISLGSLSLLFFSIYSEITHRIQKDTQVLMTETTHSLLGHIDEWLDKNLRALRSASKQSAITAMDAPRQTEILQNIREEYPWVYLVFTLDKRGMNLARSCKVFIGIERGKFHNKNQPDSLFKTSLSKRGGRRDPAGHVRGAGCPCQ